MQFDEVLRTFAAFFEREGIRYALVGGLAIHALGHTRATDDVDFVVELSNQKLVAGFAESQGYETIYVSEGFSNHVGRDGRVDFMYVDEATARKLFASTTTYQIFSGVDVPVPRPEYIVAMKVVAMKNNPRRTFQEMHDIQFLMSLPGVERNEVREYFAKHGLLRLFDELEKGF